MDLFLTPNNEEFLKNKISEGVYSSINEALNATLNLDISYESSTKERIAELNNEIQKGIDDYEAGRYLDGEIAFNKLMEKYE